MGVECGCHRARNRVFEVNIKPKEALMDKKTKKLIVVIIVVVISIACAVLGVSLGVPLEALVPIGTEIIDGLAVGEQSEEVAPAVFPVQSTLPYATI